MKKTSCYYRHIVTISIRLVATITVAIFGFGAYAQSKNELVVATYGGALGATIKEAFVPFEKQHNVTIRWIAGGNSAENVARVAATKDKPEFDLVFGNNQTHAVGAAQGLWAPIDESIVTLYKNQTAVAKTPTNDIINFGLYIDGLFYQDKEFAKRGWKPPTRWADLFRPEFCGKVGFLHPNVANGLQAVIMLGGGDPAKFGEGVAKLAANRHCIPVLEPTTAKLDEKIQLGEYLIGAYGNIRVIPLIRKGANVAFVVPEEGAMTTATAVSGVKNSAHPRLVQEFLNWILTPDAQVILMEQAALSPTNTAVPIPAALAKQGVMDAAARARAIQIPERVINDNRRAWIRQVERAMAK